jgi:hypothetical protein
VLFDRAADLHTPEHFFDFPWPSDLRLDAAGAPDVAGAPNPVHSPVLEGLRGTAQQRMGFPVVPVAWFRFTADVASRVPTDVIPADPSSPILLLDVDPASPALGHLVPTVAETIAPDLYVPSSVLGVAPRPGFVLEPRRKYAFVVLRAAGDAAGAPLGVAPELARALSGGDPSDPAASLYSALPAALGAAGVDVKDVAAATVFTTGDVVADLADLSGRVLAAYHVDVTGLAVDPKVGDGNARFCELQGQVTYPQFQKGAPPYDSDGLFELGADGLPIKQHDETAPFTVTLPKQPMPAGGFPLVLFFHGTGGLSTAIADRGPWHPETDAARCPDGALETWNGATGCNTAGQGPGWVMAAHGFAMAASALPVNPQRWPAGKARDLPEYLNLNNVAPMRDIFRQGVIEQRMLIEALHRVAIDPKLVASCTGLSLPAGETAYHFRDDPLFVQGQSMGAMYANMISAVEPRVRATVATGAGGYWTYFILETQFIPNMKGKVGLLLNILQDYSHLHPAMHVTQMALEPVDPIVFMPRVGRAPLPGHPVRSIYEPHGLGDSFFPTTVQDAVALAYGNREAGSMVWPTMQQALGLAHLDGLLPYPVAGDVVSTGGGPYTGVVVQYQGDGVYDPHAIYTQLPAVKHQYACFFESLLRTNVARVPGPDAEDAPCK